MHSYLRLHFSTLPTGRQSLCCQEAAHNQAASVTLKSILGCNPSSVEFRKSSSLATGEKARTENVVKMWLVKRGSERVGAQAVRYTLLALIIFMLVCTILAIILVTFAYSTALNDRTQGKYFFAFLFLYHLFLLFLCPSVPCSVCPFSFPVASFLRFLFNRQLCHLFA